MLTRGFDPHLSVGLGSPAGLSHLDVRILEPRGGGAGVRDRARESSSARGRRRRPDLRAALPSQRRDRRGSARPARTRRSGRRRSSTRAWRRSPRFCFAMLPKGSSLLHTKLAPAAARSTSCAKCSSRSASRWWASRPANAAALARRCSATPCPAAHSRRNPRESDASHVGHRARRLRRDAPPRRRPRVAVDNTFLGPGVARHPLEPRRRLRSLFSHQVSRRL